MGYFSLDWRVDIGDDDPPFADIDNVPATDVPWTLGAIWTSGKTVPAPIEFSLNPAAGMLMPTAFLVGIPLFSETLIRTLNSAGVHNMDVHEARITDPRTNTVFTNYKAVNIVGAISCLDKARSEYDPDFAPPRMLIRRMVIDESRAHDQLFFRLAELTEVILVHEHVKRHLDRIDLIGVRLVAV